MKPLIVLTGPTAVGKTALSIELAKEVGGEIVSADSMQVYRGMDIGTAKIAPNQMQGVPHHLIDILEPWEEFHVADFQRYCKEAMADIYARGKCPIIVGGTGFYIQSVLYDIDFSETEADADFREEMEELAREEGAAALHDRLRAVDEASAEAIHPNNVKRVIRALEYYRQTGERMSEHNQAQQRKVSPYQFRYYVLRLPREILYRRINERVDAMERAGLTGEVERLLARGCHRKMVSMQGLGYKEIIDALEGRDTLEHAYERIKQETRHFAKRQFTWFRREREVTWIDKDQFRDEWELLDYCVKDCRKINGIAELLYQRR